MKTLVKNTLAYCMCSQGPRVTKQFLMSQYMCLFLKAPRWGKLSLHSKIEKSSRKQFGHFNGV